MSNISNPCHSVISESVIEHESYVLILYILGSSGSEVLRPVFEIRILFAVA